MTSPTDVTAQFLDYINEIGTRPHSLTVEEYDELLSDLPMVSSYLESFIARQKQIVVASSNPSICSAFEYRGTRAYHEDRRLCCKSEYVKTYRGPTNLEYTKVVPFKLYAVFDGHRDVDVAAYLADNFCSALVRCLEVYDTPAEAIRCCCLYLDYQIYDRKLKGGSTATGAIVIKDVCYVFNLGDSRTLMFGAVDTIVTCDHKPEAEQARIESSGFDVVAGRICMPGSPRGTGLAVSRGFGDIKYKLIYSKDKKSTYFEPLASAVTCVPDIQVCMIPASPTRTSTESDSDDSGTFILSASDGFWDVFETDYILALLGDQPEIRINSLFKEILAHPKIRDNVTVVFTRL